MNLIRFETIIDIEERTRAVTPAYAIYKQLGGREMPKERLPREPGVNIRRGNEKYAVRWHYDSCSVLHEDNTDHKFCIKHTIEILEKINEVAPIGELSRLTLVLNWILPVQGKDFTSLELKYRNNFMKSSPIFENYVDSSIIVDMEWQDRVFTHQSGAMKILQLQEEYREFPTKKGHPELFFFLHTRMATKNVLTYSSKTVNQFLTSSFEKCKIHSDNFERVMGNGGKL